MNKKVAENFSRSAKSYAMAGLFQKHAAQRMYELISTEIKDPRRIAKVLELGCGTGFLTIGLMQLLPEAAFIVSDISEKMLDRCRSNVSGCGNDSTHIAPHFECYNISDARIEKNYDLIISALAFQWISKLDPVMKNIHDHLIPGGKFIFSTLLDGTFSRLHQVFKELDIPYPGPVLLSAESIHEKCAVFKSCRITTSYHRETQPGILPFLKQIQLTGAKNATGRPISVSDMRRIIKRYSELDGNGGIEIDYVLAEVVCE